MLYLIFLFNSLESQIESYQQYSEDSYHNEYPGTK